MWNPFKPDELHEIVIRARVLRFWSERKRLDPKQIELYQKLEDAAYVLKEFLEEKKK